MSVDHGSIATHLPSFAQAFSASSLDRISSGSNSLPPIHTRPQSSEPRRVKSPVPRAASRPKDDEPIPRTAGRKRAHTEISTPHNDEHAGSDHDFQHHIKEEPEQDMLDPSPPPTSRMTDFRTITDTSGAPPPSSVHPLKKRRVTISGAPQPGALNTDVRNPPDPTNSTPISPVVIGFTVQRDNPSAVEQVRSMITVKQKQKALIEQRRGSVTTSDAPAIKPTPPARSVRRSPNAGTALRRGTNAASIQGGGSTRPPSPSPITVPSQQALVPGQAQNAMNAHSLPPPPISFARRRATQLGSGKRKPADILISPREEQTQEQFAPSIQSAPPIPHVGQGAFYSGRFPMTLPRLPSVLAGGDNVRRVMGGNVPPTPTRLATLRNSNQVSHPIPGIFGRSPPNASVAISSVLVPPTPSSLQHPGYSGDKSAFLAPFEVFYDALNDSKQLKNWLGEQLQRSNALVQSLTQQQEKLHEFVDGLVEKKVVGMKHEMAGLYRRIEELEDALRVTSAGNGRRLSADAAGKVKAKQPLRNGITSSQMAQDSYTFPPVPTDRDRLRPEVDRADRRLPSPNPGWRDPRESQNTVDSENEPSAFESRRLSISASRLDPPRSQRQTSEDSKGSFSSPPVSFRDSPHAHPPVKLVRVGSHKSPHIPALLPPPDREMANSPARREERRNSVVMSPPEGPADDRDS